MELYARNKTLTVHLTGPDELTAKAGLDDGIHDIRVTLTCKASTSEIVDAYAEMVKYPWNLCKTVEQSIKIIIGMKLGSGIRREVEHKIGRQDGCNHISDLVIEAVRGIMQGQYRLRERPETREGKTRALQKEMQGICYAYSHPELGLEAHGDWIDHEGKPVSPER